MRQILLSLFALTVVGSTVKLKAQCTVSNLAIEVVNFNTSNCQVTFNISFDQEVNSGNKFAYIHLWRDGAYHTPASAWPTSGQGQIYNGPSNAPLAAQLVNALATIAIQFNGTLSPTVTSVYGADNSVTPITSGLTVTKTVLPGGLMERETISGIVLTSSPCTGVVTFKGDIWAAQDNGGKNVHCAVQGLTFNINNPQITSAFKVCNPRSITFGIKNNGTSSLTERFLLYKDDGDGLFEPFVGAGGDGAAIFTGTDTTLAPGGIQSRFQFAYPGSTTPGENANLWLQVVVPSTGYTTVAFISNNAVSCAPLPVDFKSFTATRNRSNVLLKWETMTEQNNRGFAIERNTGNNVWQEVAFVPSQVSGGNSSDLLVYQYVDANSSKGVTQYRIRQVDNDNRSKYSQIRSVRGDGQPGKTLVYPNPSNDGRVNIVFEDKDVVRDISVADMSGRIIKQLKAVSNNSIMIDNLTPGMYSIRILTIETGEQIVEKIVVNKR